MCSRLKGGTEGPSWLGTRNAPWTFCGHRSSSLKASRTIGAESVAHGLNAHIQLFTGELLLDRFSDQPKDTWPLIRYMPWQGYLGGVRIAEYSQEGKDDKHSPGWCHSSSEPHVPLCCVKPIREPALT